MRPNAFHGVALAVLLAAGCAQPTSLLVQPTAQVAARSANLHLKLDLGRQIQDLASDISTVVVSIELSGQAPISRTFNKIDWQTDSLDFSGLPSGDATVHVRAFNDQQAQMAEGATLVPLLIGRRTLAQVYLGVSSAGRTDRLPFAPIEAGTFSVDPATDSFPTPPPGGETPPPGGETPPPGGETPPPDAQMLAQDYFVPGPDVLGRTYDMSQDVTDGLGTHSSTAVFTEALVSGDAGLQAVRSEEWTYPDRKAHRDATDSFHVMRDGSAGWDTIRTEGAGISTSSIFVPNQALTPDGALLPPDGKMWLESANEFVETPVGNFTCLRVHLHRGPIDGGMDTTFWVAQGFGVVQLMRHSNGLTPDGKPITIDETLRLSNMSLASSTAYRVRR